MVGVSFIHELSELITDDRLIGKAGLGCLDGWVVWRIGVCPFECSLSNARCLRFGFFFLSLFLAQLHVQQSSIAITKQKKQTRKERGGKGLLDSEAVSSASPVCSI